MRVLGAPERTPCTEGTTLRAEASTTLDLARLLIILPTTHLSFETTSFHKFSEAADRLLNRFAIANAHRYHSFSQYDDNRARLDGDPRLPLDDLFRNPIQTTRRSSFIFEKPVELHFRKLERVVSLHRDI